MLNYDNPLIKERLEKLKQIKDLEIDPYPYSFNRSNNSKELQDKFGNIKPEEVTKKIASVAGRIMLMRNMGKVTFIHLEDLTGRIQVYLRESDLKEKYKLVKRLDLGDFIGVSGKIFKTKMGELSIWSDHLEILAKSIRPLPDKHAGLQDKEIRYRQRYVDLAVNKEVREVFIKRSKIISAVREFLDSKGFLEVEIPTLQSIYGGAAARPFTTHLNAWNMQMFLSISPELYLKRLIVGGLERVYTITKNFRNEGVDKTHNPEFTSMEFYCSYIDYNELMTLTEQCFEFVAKKVLGTTKINYQGKQIDLKGPWERLTMYDAIKKYGNIEIKKLSDVEIKDLLNKFKIEIPGLFNRGLAIAEIFEAVAEEHLIQPVHIIDHPKETSPLCKLKRGDKELIERVESYINGWELTNGYSELTDPKKQYEEFKSQEERGRGGDEEAQKMDEDYVKALEFGLPPTGGLGIGIDRMVMLLTNQPTIKDVILFPTMKPEEEF
ncbi:lysine--tRNA ligase [Candidatus Woesearchaeota archaeon]|nr:lysine--tRNA ligase [Candidatus Woesearchaeota archaeon]